MTIRGHAFLPRAAALLALAGLAAPAQEKAKPILHAQASPALEFLDSHLPDPGAALDGVRRFRATALRDLKESGVFRLLDPSGAPRSGDPASLGTWRGAGSSLLVRFASRSLEKGKLLIEGECINLETGAVVLKKNFMGETAAAGRMAHRLVDFMVGKVTGTSGVADSTIVVARSTGPGIKELFRLDRDGGNPRQITSFGSLTTHPAVAADGKLAFVTYKGGPPQIWGQSQPNGPFQRLYPPPGASGLELSGLAWSPDGGRLCFVQENRKGLSDIHLLDLRSGVEAQLTPGGRSSRGPCWNASGTEIAYLSDQDGTPQVYIMAADGTRARRLTADPAPKDGVAWNAQGDRIGFVARQDGRIGLYTVSPSGADCRKLASSPDPVESLCWSPDGRWLLLGLKARDGSRLCAAGLDGRLQDLDASPGGGQFPQWTQDPIALASLPPAGTSPALPGPAPVGATSLP